MSSTGWRNASLVLGIICVAQLWRSCTQAPPEPTAPDATSCAKYAPRGGELASRTDREERSVAPRGEAAADGLHIYGFTVPSWALALAPQSGEDMRSYRDRMLPLAQAAVAPHRARVARSRDNFAALANLDDHQRAELDGAAREAATQIQERVLGALLNGEFAPATFKPMTGVGVAKDLIDIIDRENKRFLGSLRDDQRAKLAQHPFDFADYLVFSTPWEDALKFLD
jgi:hypothetical protein